MTIEERNKLKKIASQGLKKAFSISETDLISRDEKQWLTAKDNFKSLIQSLLSNLENDDYKDADGEITRTISILNQWKRKIDKGISDSTD